MPEPRTKRARVSTAGTPTVAETTGVPDGDTHLVIDVGTSSLTYVPPAPQTLVKGARVLYTNRLGVGPWPGEIEAVHVAADERGPLHWINVVKPNGNDFFTCSPMGDGPDAFTLADS